MTTFGKRDDLVRPRILERLADGPVSSATLLNEMTKDLRVQEVSRSDVRLAILDLMSEGEIEMAGIQGLRRK